MKNKKLVFFNTMRRKNIPSKMLIILLMALFNMNLFGVVSEEYAEKIYLKLSRLHVVSGDEIYFTAIGHSSIGEFFSKYLYVELIDINNNKFIDGKIFSLTDGATDGEIFIPDTLHTGIYQIRSYTGWMKNFDSECVFKQNIIVYNRFKEDDLRVINSLKPEFYTTNDNLLANTTNEYLIRIPEYDTLYNSKGYILDMDKKIIDTFFLDKKGIAISEITPQENNTYFISYNDELLPLKTVVTKANNMIITESGNKFKITADIQFFSLYDLVVYNNGHLIKRTRIKDDQTIEFRADTLNGFLDVQLQNLESKECLKKIYALNNQISVTDDKNLLVFKSGQKASVDIPVTENLAMENYACSISRIEENNDFIEQEELYNVVGVRNNWNDKNRSIIREILGNVDIKESNSYLRFVSENSRLLESPPIIFPVENNGLTYQVSKIKSDSVNTKIVMVLPSQKPYFQYTNSDSLFYFNIDFQGSETAYFTGDIKNMKRESQFLSEFSEIPEEKNEYLLIGQTEYTKQIRNRSLINKVYAMTPVQKKLDKEKAIADYYYGTPKEVYFPKDYISFTNTSELLNEVIPNLRYRKGGDNKISLLSPNVTGRIIPQLLIDGIPVENHSIIEFIDQKNVDRIEIIRDSRIYSGYLFPAVVAIYTLNPKVISNLLADKYFVTEIKTFSDAVKVDYSAPTAKRLPDMRELLYWKSFADESSRQNITFQVSQVRGKYQINVQGITVDGQLVSYKQNFIVE